MLHKDKRHVEMHAYSLSPLNYTDATRLKLKLAVRDLLEKFKINNN